MTPLSIRSHLSPYKIFEERRTTINHAFASAISPHETYDESRVAAALKALGQSNLKKLTCVYCEREATTWDHLVNLVKEEKLSGYGHQLGNLVPACVSCNSGKNNSPFEEFVKTSDRIEDARRANLITILKNHLSLAKPLKQYDPSEKKRLDEIYEIKSQILQLMKDADEAIAKFHAGGEV